MNNDKDNKPMTDHERQFMYEMLSDPRVLRHARAVRRWEKFWRFVFVFIPAVIPVLIVDQCSARSPKIPNHAQIFVVEEYRYWMPNEKSVWAPVLDKYEGRNASTRGLKPKPGISAAIEKRVATTYAKVKPGGRYEGFTMRIDPEKPATEDETKRYTFGSPKGLVKRFIFPSPGRWNEDGSWNW